MGTIAQDLALLASNKAAIKAAIKAKNPSSQIDGKPMSEWASEIENIPEGSLKNILGIENFYGVRGQALYKPTTDTVHITATSLEGESVLEYAFAKSGVKNVVFDNLSVVDSVSALSNTFYSSSIESVSFNSLVEVSAESAFYKFCNSCPNLKTVTIPVKKILAKNAFLSAFQYCTSLTELNFDGLEVVGGYSAMGYVGSYTKKSGTSQFSIQDMTFSNLHSIGYVDKESDTTIYNAATFAETFNYIANTEVSFPSLTRICNSSTTQTGSIFVNNKTITSISMPSLVSLECPETSVIGGGTAKLCYLFGGCTGLLSVDISGMTADYAMSRGAPFGVPNTNCVFTCSDGTIEYVDGVWSKVVG